MKIDFSQHLVDYLNRFNTVLIPGIGQFEKVFTSASFKENRHQLEAPSVDITFTSSKNESDHLAQWIAVREGITLEQAQGVIAHFSESKNKDLNLKGKTKIYPFGTLSLTDNGIYLSPSDHALINPYLNMQEIHVTPAARTEEEKIKATDQKKDAFAHLYTEKEESNPLWRWLGILVLALALIFLFKYCSSKKDKESNNSLGHELIDSTQEKGALADSSEIKLAGKVDSVQSKSGIVADEKIHIDALTNENLDTVLESEDLKKASPTTLVDCVIILGAYKKQRNAIRMMRDVENAGYKLYVGVNGDLTRVGLTYNCAKADLVAYIQNIRREFVREAWYLVPQLRVEYED